MRKKGFSLPELLVAVAVFGLLAIVMYWMYSSGQGMFHRTTKQKDIQAGIRGFFNMLTLDMQSCYEIEQADNNGIVIKCFNGDAYTDYKKAPELSTIPEKIVKIEYLYDSSKKTITHLVNGKKRDVYYYINDFKVKGFTVKKGGSAGYTLDITTNTNLMIGIGIYVLGKYEDKSMHGKEDRLELESKFISPFRRNLIIYGLRPNGFKEGGYFTNLEVPFDLNDKF